MIKFLILTFFVSFVFSLPEEDYFNEKTHPISNDMMEKLWNNIQGMEESKAEFLQKLQNQNTTENEIKKLNFFSQINYNHSNSESKRKTPQLLVIGLDGFRYDYSRFFNIPTFDKIAQNGVWAPHGLIPAFCTKTFPNFWSIATGLYQETHGIVDNYFFDPERNETFNLMKEVKNKAVWYEKAEPIWSTAIRQNLTTGVLHWAGSDVKVNGILPNFYRNYSNKDSFKSRIDLVLNWIIHENVDLAMIYLNEPDHISHILGPFAKEVRNKVEELDDLIAYALQKLHNHSILNNVNVMLVSDHGMAAPFTKDFNIVIDDYIDVKSNIKHIPVYGPIMQILPYPEKLMYVYNKLKYAHPNMHVYLKENLPERWHYIKTVRVLPIICIADEGYIVKEAHDLSDQTVGFHGYDNELDSMKPMFYAMGPDFVKGKQVKSFESINLYNLMARLLRINPAKNNGTQSLIDPLLKENSFIAFN